MDDSGDSFGMVRTAATPTRNDFARYLEEYPATLALWQGGEESLDRVLGSLNVYPVALEREEAARVGPHLTTMLYHAAHHNQVGVTAAWAIQHMRGRDPDFDPPLEELEKAFATAGTYWSLKNAMADVYVGTRGFKATGRKIEMPYTGNRVFEATDRLLDMLERVQAMPEGPPAEWEQLRQLELTVGRDRPWDALPLELREELRAFARSLVASQERYLDPVVDVGGFTMGEAERVLIELYARAWHSATQILLGCHRRDVVLPALPPRQLVSQVAIATGVSSPRVATVVDLLTADLAACPDPCLTPLIPLPDGRLALMSSLMTPGAVVRNFTARVQLDHTRFGEAGRQLGLLGSRTVAQTLRRRLVDVKVAERVKVFHRDGRQAGDFDVVVFEPATKQIVIFEVLWRISPDGSAEVNELERRAHEKRQQVNELRDAVTGGAAARWPSGWDVPAEAAYRWFILTPSILPALPLDEGDVPVRSHRALASFRWPGTAVADMVDTLLHPPEPPSGLSETEWVQLRFGQFEVSVEIVRA